MLARRCGWDGKKPVVIGILCILLSACTVGPDYVRPKSTLPAQWSGLEGTQPQTDPADLARWWTLFRDPILDELIERAIASNKELRIAEARIVKARARRGVVAADGYPEVNARAAYSRTQNSSNVSASTRDRRDGTDPGSGSAPASKAPPRNLFTVGFDASC